MKMSVDIVWLGDGFSEICAESPIWQRAWQDFGQASGNKFEGSLGRGFVVAECSSTFDALLELPKCLPSLGTLRPWDWLVACRQDKGRGQYGRYWHSPLGNLCVSQVLPVFAEYNTLLPMLLAKTFAAVLCRRGFDVRLKWPNDLLLFSGGELLGKLGGLLLEQKRSCSVFGFGLNLVPVVYEERQGQGAVLAPAYINVEDVLSFWAECCGFLQRAWSRWCGMAEAALRDELEQSLAFLGQEVELFTGDSRVCGTLLGIGEHGALRLQTSEGLVTSLHGSLRPL